jgi:formylglycine-generating enzyme required for sulfatase activity
MTADPVLLGAVLSGGYRVVSVVGEGHDGGVVYLAEGEGGTRFAVRCPRVEPGFAPDEVSAALARFEAEARKLAALGASSADVEQLVAHGIANARGVAVPYAVFAWLEGQPLDRWASAQPGLRPAAEVLVLLAPVFRALATAHRQGIVHRNVRPGNVWIAYADGRTTVKLTGFGLASHLGRGEAPFEIAYGAPEHFKRTYGAFSPATDVFGLALLVVELVSGKPALVGKDTVELFLAASDLAKRPTLRARGAQVSAALEAVVARALAVDPRRRWEGAQELWDALHAAMPELTPAAPSVRPAGSGGEARAPDPRSPPLPSPHAAPAAAEAVGAADRARAPRGPLIVGTLLAMVALGVLGSLVLLPGGSASAPSAPGAPQKDARAEADSNADAAGATPEAAFTAATLRADASDAADADADAGFDGDPAVVRPFPTDMLRVPAGAFVMGTDKEGKGDGPAHRVVLTHAFYIDRTEVTTSAYAACVAKGACSPVGVHSGDVVETTWGCNADKDRPNHPVNCVDRAQSARFCASLGKRLPTEAEWEYAARGDGLRAYPWGNEEPSDCEQAVLPGVKGACGEKKGTSDVASTPLGKSPVGAFDMAGNVWEWVSDGYEPYPSGEVTDPAVAPKTGSRGILRGGSWDYSPTSARTTYRLPFQASSGNVSIGFRCARFAD